MRSFVTSIAICCLAVSTTGNSYESSPPRFSPTVLATETHNPNWFTQGLFISGDDIYISSGLYGHSRIIARTGNQTWQQTLPDEYFAEGLTVIGDRLYLLTWKENTLFVFDRHTGKLLQQHPYDGQGWGLTHNKQAFIMSNGSAHLLFRDIDDFTLQRTLTVKDLNKINELEYVKGIIWANRWYDDNIYAIDSQSGCVLGSINLSPLRRQATDGNHRSITNGIAYDAEHNGLWVTGKYWKQRFLIKIPNSLKRQSHC